MNYFRSITRISRICVTKILVTQVHLIQFYSFRGKKKKIHIKQINFNFKIKAGALVPTNCRHIQYFHLPSYSVPFHSTLLLAFFKRK